MVFLTLQTFLNTFSLIKVELFFYLHFKEFH